ncbi:ATP-binding protein [Bdellovibrio sp. 22V]|uniref:ATP-binding protein n=1 Tax=Bdellovibrio TaxID=958 RepID=UPI002542FFD4|nr:ATP-binding protein [Bdellovibrio sp. 22V]WII71942.1 ATP-binding protein [Bdellovibrio sp. 22V]
MSLVLSTKISRKLHFIFASVVFLVSIIVMIGWILRDITLIQIRPDYPPMVFNTALCLGIYALGILFSERDPRYAKAASAFVFIVSAITLGQYITGKNWGIDTLVFKPLLGTATETPGRMSLSSTVCFLILSFAGFYKRRVNSHQFICATAATLVVGFSTISLLSYFANFDAKYAWGSFLAMAAHTAGCLLLLALALLWQKRLQIRSVTQRQNALVPFYVLIVGILTSVLIWHLLVMRDFDRNKSITHIRGESLKSSLDNVFYPLEKSLQQMSYRFASGAYLSEKYWRIDAENYFNEFQGLRRLLWSDENRVARWVYPLTDGGKLVLNTSVGFEAGVLESYRRVYSERRPFLSRVFELRSGGKGFVLLVPIFRDEKYLGVVSAAVMAEPFFTRVLNNQGYDLAILEKGKRIYSIGDIDKNLPGSWTYRTHYSNMGVDWEILLVPKASTIRENSSAMPSVVLLFGVSVSALLGLALSFYNRARESEKEAKEAFEWKKASMNSSAFLMISLDEKGFIREMNATAERMLGYTTEELAGKETPWIYHDVKQVMEFRDKMVAELGRPIGLDIEFFKALFQVRDYKASEWTLISRSGKKYSMVLSASEIRNEAGQTTGYLGIFEDVTELRQRELLLQEQEQKILASSRLASLGEMAAGIAHEINNPLAIINGHVGILRRHLQNRGLDKEEDMVKKIDSIEAVVQRIAKIIRGLRSYAREADQGAKEWVRVESLIDDTLSFCHEKFRIEGVELKAQIEPHLEIHVRPYQISQVVLNLLNNALDAVLASKEKRVVIEACQKQGGVEISVMDSGAGVPYHLRERIMEPFFTTKEVGKGVGLGLSISQGIIQSHGGKFYLDDAGGKTRFVIWLPEDENETTDSKPSPL